ncbi:molybdopterin-dependent oxidoreductase [Saxibacter everestensis]|uniref:Molybdopterin-dependent oxidoreductase n=1 Tax=Saxibacter everestensis TaxID=2909229 RepID=A0ABY8QRB0_9MICO|nr:molybdopterin-dependent oxidoreductase [Brevibacteriaceae bacterium ZFBP1038]
MNTNDEPTPPAPGQTRGAKLRRLGLKALAGVLSAGLALGIAELITVLTGARTSPVLAIGSVVVDSAPKGVKDFAIATFGIYDKIALLVGMGLAIAALSAIAGVLERRSRPYGSAIFVVFGALGVIAAVTRVGAGVSAALPTVIGVAIGIVALRLLTGALRPAEETSNGPGGTAESLPVNPRSVRRRGFVQLSVGTALIAVVSATIGRLVTATVRGAQASREAIRLPRPGRRATIPDGAQLEVDGVSDYVTGNADFYRIDTALQVPQISTDDWSLRIHGMVDKEVELSFDQLLKKPLIERVITLSCVSNEVGGTLAGNAVWLGYPIRLLLEEAGVSRDADMVLSSSQDGYTAGTPLEALTDPGRDSILAVAMNGEPLPLEHGFPVRMVVPGLYGYVSATKWVVDLEVTRFDQKQAYWTPRGYAERAPIKLASRIDVPKSFAKIGPGKIAVAGVAWAQHTGISKVEVRIDEGSWQEATLAEVPGPDTWRQWRYEWTARDKGNHYIYVRATDADGNLQTDKRADPLPDGATGLHNRMVRVE